MQMGRGLVLGLVAVGFMACASVQPAPVVYRAEAPPRALPPPIPQAAVAPGLLTVTLVDGGVPLELRPGLPLRPNPVLSILADGVPLSRFAAEVAKVAKVNLHVEAAIADVPVTMRARALTLAQLGSELRSDWVTASNELLWSTPHYLENHRGGPLRENSVALLEVRPEAAVLLARAFVAFGVRGDETAEAVDGRLILVGLPELLSQLRPVLAFADEHASDFSVDSVSCHRGPPASRRAEVLVRARNSGSLVIERTAEGSDSKQDFEPFELSSAQRRMRFRVSADGVPLHRFATEFARVADLELLVEPDMANVPVNVNGSDMTLSRLFGLLRFSAYVEPSRQESSGVGQRLMRLQASGLKLRNLQRQWSGSRELQTVGMVFGSASLAAGAAAQLCSRAAKADFDTVATVGNVLIVRASPSSLELSHHLAEALSPDETIVVERFDAVEAPGD